VNKKPYYILYGAIGTAALAAMVAFLQHWDVLFYLAIVTLFYVGLWAVGRASALEKEGYARFMEAETLRDRIRVVCTLARAVKLQGVIT
jgi:hypothetical protein